LETTKEGVSPFGNVRLVREEEDDVVCSLRRVEDGVEISRWRDDELKGCLEPQSTASSREGEGGKTADMSFPKFSRALPGRRRSGITR
jgi:hypothetical protein